MRNGVKTGLGDGVLEGGRDLGDGVQKGSG